MDKKIEKVLSKDFFENFSQYEFDEKSKYEILHYMLFESDKEPEDTLEELSAFGDVVAYEETSLIGVMQNMVVNLIIQTYEVYAENRMIENLLV